jgi:hypothetical protein
MPIILNGQRPPPSAIVQTDSGAAQNIPSGAEFQDGFFDTVLYASVPSRLANAIQFSINQAQTRRKLYLFGISYGVAAEAFFRGTVIFKLKGQPVAWFPLAFGQGGFFLGGAGTQIKKPLVDFCVGATGLGAGENSIFITTPETSGAVGGVNAVLFPQLFDLIADSVSVDIDATVSLTNFQIYAAVASNLPLK